MTCVIAQARLDSTRLPGKALLPFGGATILDCVLRSLRTVGADAWVLATDADSAESFRPIAEESGFALFVGPKEDVLARFCDAARAFEADTVIRATCDNPFVSRELADALVADFRGDADYAAFTGMPIGLGTELIAGEALYRAERDARDPYEREHVAPYLYRNPDRFKIVREEAPAAYVLPEGRVTIDTPDDYRFAIGLLAELGASFPVDGKRLVEALKRGRRARIH